eukprot:scaffold219173_cov49-Attheya_sp.AAC.3
MMNATATATATATAGETTEWWFRRMHSRMHSRSRRGGSVHVWILWSVLLCGVILVVYPHRAAGDNHYANTLAKNHENDTKLKQLVTTFPDDNDDSTNDVSSRTKRSHAQSPNDPTTSSNNNQKKKKTDGPEVVWLMSFPNSGTSYTIMNTERMTNATTA